MRSVFVVPRRADHGRRDELWAWCKPHWEAQGEVFEGDHEDGPFNRSAAINSAAAKAGDFDVIVIIDGDVYVPPEQVSAAIQRSVTTGRACFAFTDYFALRRQMTDQVMAGYTGNWKSNGGTELKMLAGRHVSSCIVVPRALWDKVGGFDERFHGWGAEDVAFMHSCRTLGGGVDRVPGAVWHLWHPVSAERDKTLPDYRAGAALANGYIKAIEPADMRSLIDGRRTPNAVCLLVMTDGRRETIAECLPTALRHLKGNITRRLIHDDSGDPEFAAWLRLEFPDFEIHSSGKRSGFGGAVHRAWNLALEQGHDWVVHVEDDFRFDRDVDLSAMQSTLTEHPELAQMALRRQAWFPKEIAAGGVCEALGLEHFTQHDGHFDHDQFFTTNPCLLPRSIVARGWPNKPHSEALFSRALFKDGFRSAYWGDMNDDPWVEHIGVRSGTGY